MTRVLVGVFALLFFAFSAWDMWALLSGLDAYAETYSRDMLVWIQGFPFWRKAVWATSIGAGLAGAGALIANMGLARILLWLSLLLAVSGLGADIALFDGVANYGGGGLLAAAILYSIQLVLALLSIPLIGSPGRARRTLAMGSLAASLAVIIPRVLYDVAVSFGADVLSGGSLAFSLASMAAGVAIAIFMARAPRS